MGTGVKEAIRALVGVLGGMACAACAASVALRISAIDWWPGGTLAAWMPHWVVPWDDEPA